MNIEIVTERSVLVELTPAELSAWKLSYESLNEKNDQTSTAIRNSLGEIVRQTGRTLLPRPLEIDLLPSRAGGCLMIISQIDASRKKRQQSLICTFTSVNALLDCLAACRCTDLSFTVDEGYRFGDTFGLIVNQYEASALPFLREFGKVWKADDYAIAQIREAGERLKVFCGSSAQV